MSIQILSLKFERYYWVFWTYFKQKSWRSTARGENYLKVNMCGAILLLYDAFRGAGHCLRADTASCWIYGYDRLLSLIAQYLVLLQNAEHPFVPIVGGYKVCSETLRKQVVWNKEAITTKATQYDTSYIRGGRFGSQWSKPKLQMPR